MKRDMDLVRELLMHIESAPDRFVGLPELNDHPRADLIEHVRLCADAGLLEAKFFNALDPDEDDVHNIRLTWSGHEFLDATRSPEIWEKAKSGAAKVGSTSLKLLFEIASGYAKAELGRLGVPMI